MTLLGVPRLPSAGGFLVIAALMAGAGRLSGLDAQGSEPVVYDVDGTRIVQLSLPGRDVVAVNVYLLGGARQLTPATAGIERLILRASEYGTEGFPGGALREAQVATGSRFFVRITPDWSVIGFTGLVEEFERSWAILADRVVRPSLDSASLEVVRGQALTSVHAARDDPDDMVIGLAERLAFDGHAYAVDVDGTEESLASLGVVDLRAYHTEHFVRSRMLLSVVGTVDRGTVEAAVRRTLNTLPVGSYMWQVPEPWSKPKADVLVENRALPTNYILGYFAGPTAGGGDYPAFQVAVNTLSAYVFDEIRERGLSYAAGARLLERAAAGGGVYVSTADPEAALRIVNKAISLFRQGTIPRSLLRDYAERSTLDYYLANQTSSQQADFLASSLLLRGRPQSVVAWVRDLRGVSGNEVRTIFRKYIKNIQYAFLGSGSAAPRDLMLRY